MSFKELPHTVVSRLPRGLILPSQVHYAVANGSSNNDPAADIDGDIFGQPFSLGASDAPLPVDVASAELFLIPHQVFIDLKEGLESILERLIPIAKPGTMVLIATPAAAGDIGILTDKSFELISFMPAGDKCLALYRNTGSNEKQSNGTLTNGTHQAKVSILEPSTSSPQAQSLSKKLQTILEDQGYSVTTQREVPDPDAIASKTWISLLELEKPVLENLSELDFRSIQRLMVSSERLLWITCGDNPSFESVDDLARCVNNEVATAKFQILHLSGEGMQHGPSLVTRILTSLDKTKDNEFRERGGLLQMQRIYQSPRENNQIRSHLEDSIRAISFDDDSACFSLAIGKPGLLDSLHFVRDESTLSAPLADEELKLQVKATGVNNRDIMTFMSLIPVTTLGVEASDVVLRAGNRAAQSFRPDDRVCTLSMSETHASETRCNSLVTAKILDAMPFEETAATLMMLSTAYYVLVGLAHVRRGQSVLIHAAAGGVGQAAIQLATHLGVVVYVTVDSEEKRRFVMKQYGIPEEHVFNSRDTSFAKDIRRVTGERGVDCVLNHLSGELLRVS